MSDEVSGMPAAEPAADPAAPTAGALLRKARENAGLHVAALAVSMKVPVKKLEALEADRLDLLPDSVFVRALASSVCRTLKIDAAPILSLLPQNAIPKLGNEDRSINTPFRASGEARSHTLPDLFKKPVFVAVALLLLGALAVVFWPESEKAPAVAETPADPKAAEPLMPPEPAGTAANEAKPAEQANAATPAVEIIPSVPVKPVAAPVAEAAKPVVAASSPAAIAPAVAPAPKAVASAPVAAGPSAGNIMVLKAKGPSWVEVVDAKGVVQVRKILAAGESLAASGQAPLAVVVGRADAIEVEVRGKPFSLEGIAKDNVARFEVK